MAKMNRCEAEVDAIRDKIYEETRHLTRDEQIQRVNEQAQRFATQYGFRICKPQKREKELAVN